MTVSSKTSSEKAQVFFFLDLERFCRRMSPFGTVID